MNKIYNICPSQSNSDESDIIVLKYNQCGLMTTLSKDIYGSNKFYALMSVNLRVSDQCLLD